MITKAIGEQADAIVRNFRNLSNKMNVKYEIRVMDTNTQQAPGIFAQDTGTGDEIVSLFQQQLYSALSDTRTACVEVDFIKPKTKAKTILSSHRIVIREYPRIVEDERKEPQTPPQPQTPPNTGFGSLSGVLSLLGYQGQTSLNGIDESPIAGLGAILAIRDQRIEEKFARERRDEDFGRVKSENDQLRDENKDLKKKLEKQISQNQENEEYIAELEKLRPEASIAGVSLVGVGTTIVQNLIKKNAGFIGSLMGVDKATAQQMLSGEDTDETPSAAPPAAPVEVDPVEITPADDPRSQRIAEISAYLRQLDDTLFANIYNVMMLFAQNPENISETLKHLNNEQV